MNPEIINVRDAYPDHDLDPYFIRDSLALSAERLEQIPDRFAGATVTVPQVAQWVRDVVDTAVRKRRSDCISVRTGPSLLIIGVTGVGKTHQAYGAVRALAVSGVRCMWRISTAADIYAAMRPRPRVDSEEVFQRYASAQLLMVDDLGAAKNSEWVEEVNYRLINHRYEHRLPTLITSNVPPKELGSELGERVASRLIEMTTRVVIKGGDRRKGMTAA